MAAPFIINTRDLARRPGSMRQVALTVAASEPLGSEVIAIPAGTPIHLDLRLEAVSEGVLVTGTASSVATGECVRCLREVTEDVEVDLTELFAYEGTRSQRTVAGDSEDSQDVDPLPVLDGDLLDLEATVTDAVVPSLPFQPLCDPDCAGLCSECGVRLDDAEPDHHHEVLDPRWAALSALASREESEGEEEAPR
ncbi:YceD family protein [Pseudactinotalea suaedae]|uniref:YceD family protein n=1 Tax=Pseudactinotalea suaedae TaxID=1524924 RepID=UPI0012E263A6|nr:YceD family protein [Pseudactinotalea suaedae]